MADAIAASWGALLAEDDTGAALGGADGQLPSQRRLRELGRSDLMNAVQRLGGAARAADLLELKARPRGRAHSSEAPS